MQKLVARPGGAPAAQHVTRSMASATAMTMICDGVPPEGTLARWAWDYLGAQQISDKFELGEPPRAEEYAAPARPDARATRPRELVTTFEKAKTPGPEALRAPARRASLVHTFLHHEMQAAELMCWAILAFPGAPPGFRRGLAAIARDEVHHMRLYQDYLLSLGYHFGEFPVRDWFWERVPQAGSPASFVATLGMGFEGGNLDHTTRFAARFRRVGDEAGARLQEIIFEEEIPHVRFAVKWFRELTGRDDFATWVDHLPAPLSPMLMKGSPVHTAARLRSGLSATFIEQLAAWQCKESGV